MKPKLTSGRRNVSPMIGADFVFAAIAGNHDNDSRQYHSRQSFLSGES